MTIETNIKVAVDSSPVKTAAQALQEMATAGNKAETATQALERASKQAGQEAARAGREASAAARASAREQEAAAKVVERANKDAAASSKRASQEAAAEASRAAKEQAAAARTLAREQERAATDAARGQGAASRAALREQAEAAKALARTQAAGQTAAALAQRQAAAAVGRQGYQTAQLSAQLQDLFVQIQAGGSPLTALIQQGSQLHAVFGGVKPVIAALSQVFTPFRLVVGGAAGAVGALALAAYQGSQEQNEYRRTLILSGNAAGTTASQISAMAAAIKEASGGSQGRAGEVLSQLAATGKVAASSLQAVADTAIRLEKVGGPAAEATVEAFAALGKDPVNASLKLNETTNYLTASLYEQIKALADQGKTTEAAALAQRGYADALNDRIPKLSQNLGYLEQAWRAAGKAATLSWDAMKGVGRDVTPDEEIARVEQRIAALKLPTIANQANPARTAQRLADQQALLGVMRAQNKAEADSATASADRAKKTTAAVEFEKIAERSLTKQQQLAKDIARIREIGVQAGKSEAEIQKQIAAAREKGADKGAAGAASRTAAAKLALDLENLQTVSDSALASISNNEKLLEARRTAGMLSDQQYYGAKTALIREEAAAQDAAIAKQIERLQAERLTGADALANAKRIADLQGRQAIQRASSGSQIEVLEIQQAGKAREAYVKIMTEADKATTQYNETLKKENETLKEGNKSATERLQEIGLTAEELGRLRVARIDATIAEAEAALVQRAGNELSEEQVGFLTERIRLLKVERDIQSGTNTAEVKVAQKKLAEEAGKELNSEVKTALSNAFRDTSGNPLESFGSALANVVYTRMTESVATALADALVGTGKGGSSGLFGDLFGGAGGLLGKLFSFDGGGYTGSGARSGGLDGKGGFMALMHPRETVTDHTKGQTTSGGQTVNLYLTQHVGDVATVSMLEKSNQRLVRQMQGGILRSQTYGGAMS
ncbi:MAG: phage tail length tape measure family protein [Pseudomonadota bacterium]